MVNNARIIPRIKFTTDLKNFSIYFEDRFDAFSQDKNPFTQISLQTQKD